MLAVAAVVLVVLTWVWAVNHVSRSREESYAAWVKLTGRADITFEEFCVLNQAGHLRGSQRTLTTEGKP